MDSPSSTTIELDALQELRSSVTPVRSVVVVSFGDPVAQDYAAWSGHPAVDLSKTDILPESLVANVVLVLPSRLSAERRKALERVLAAARNQGTRFITIISTFRTHLQDSTAIEAETHVRSQLLGANLRVVVIRPGHVLSPNSKLTRALRRFSFVAPLVLACLRTTCVDSNELFAAVHELSNGQDHRRIYTLLGPNRPWQEWLRAHRQPGYIHACLNVICCLLSLFMIGQLAFLAFILLCRYFPTMRAWNFDTLQPTSFRELLALYNPFNYHHVKVVGYNNGVVHFGHQYPGRTVVSTVLCNRIHRVGPSEIKAECGATIHKTRNFLANADQELFVLPNYSYVCLGTAFFVPIHGSASDYATVAETITRVLLYDPGEDRFVQACSDEPAFRETAYNLVSNVLVLRVWLQVKPKSRYFVRREKHKGAGAELLLDALRDEAATNVEIRKAHASSGSVEISRYYQAAVAGENLLESPRDALGRLWDRLEENAITSYLMHTLTRWFVWHIELFFTAEEFTKFWTTHQSIPLRKIQVRYIRRDGLPHSPFCEHDCVSVDLFTFRWNRKHFERYLKQTFGVVRTNPGKHSQ